MPYNPTHANTRKHERGRVLFDRERTYMPTRLLRPQRMESAGGVRHRGSYTAPSGRRFEAGAEGWGLQLRDVQVGDGLVLGTPVVPSRSYLGRSEAYEPVSVTCPTSSSPTLRTLKSARKPLDPYLSGTLPVHPTRTLAHPSTNTKPKYLPPNKLALNPYSASTPSAGLSISSFRTYLFHPAVCA